MTFSGFTSKMAAGHWSERTNRVDKTANLRPSDHTSQSPIRCIVSSSFVFVPEGQPMMQYRRLGRTGLEISVVGFGTAQFRLVPEPALAIGDNTTRNQEMQNASNFTRISCFVIHRGLLCKAVKFAGQGVLFNLAAPLIRIVILKPFAKSCKLARSKFPDFPFQFLNSSHLASPYAMLTLQKIKQKQSTFANNLCKREALKKPCPLLTIFQPGSK